MREHHKYDARNFPIKKSGLPGDINYTYDNNGQLRGVAGLQSENFDYDAIGNRILDQNGNFVYDQNSQQLTEDWQYFYSYDHNGNLIKKIPKDQSKSAYNYSYNSKNQLIRLEITSTALGPVIKEIIYSYDVLGRRMEKRINDLVDSSKTYARRFVYDGDNILGEYSQSGALLASYIHSPLTADDVLEVTYTPEAVQAGMTDTYGYFYYLKDHLGSVTEIADTSGHVVQRYNYSAFGKILDIKDATGTDISANPRIRGSFTFTGREWDEESGLYFYRARMYDANIGRFLQIDPYAGDLGNPTSFVNRYAYASNSPSQMIDPSGNSNIFGWALSLAFPMQSFIAMNTSNLFQSNFGFSTGDIKAYSTMVLSIAIIGAAVLTGGVAGGAAGGGIAGAFAGASAGSLVGAIIGGFGFPILGLGNSSQGASFGGILGAIAGGYMGYFGSASSYSIAGDGGTLYPAPSAPTTPTPVPSPTPAPKPWWDINSPFPGPVKGYQGGGVRGALPAGGLTL